MRDFIATIADVGFTPPSHIVPGKFYRYPGLDKKPSNRAAYCILFDDGRAGVFGDFSTGFQETWTTGGSRKIKREEMAKIVEARRHREADLEIMRQDAAVEAHQVWCAASTEIIHAYPASKKITPYGARQADNRLLIPMYFSGKLVNTQRIFPNGEKRFMKGGRVTSCYAPLGKLTDHIHVCEGFATGCSLHDHLPTVCVAFNAGNLKPVALSIRKKYPDIRITVCCDNDVATKRKTGINPGLEKGRAAAAAVDGDIIYPDFSDEDFTGTDYNDYLTQGGAL